jgi:hypothetical protein
MGVTGNGYEVSFWGDENVLELTEVMVALHCTKYHQNVVFKMVILCYMNFM